MAKNSKIAGMVLGSIFAATALTAANDAMALEVGQCGTSTEIQNALRAEGQYPLVSGFRSIPTRPRNLFTTNQNLSLGYNLEGDGTQICVGAKYTDIQLNTNANFARPTWANVGPSTNSPFVAWLGAQEQRTNLQVIFGARNVVRGNDGIEHKGAFVTVVQGNGDQFVQNRGVFVGANTQNGTYAVVTDLEDITINRTNFDQLASISNTPTVLASNQPK